MENETVERDNFEPKPGFDLVKYGDVFTFNFNQEFAWRLKNLLADFHRNNNLQEPVEGFFKSLCKQFDLPAGVGADAEVGPSSIYIMERLRHVYTVVCLREFAQSLNQVLSQFLVQKRVSPALFSFAKQLESALYPRRFDTKQRYADEF